jgi:predicted AlkP superfamily pyrophosphatase or phosphodiesterase
MKVSSYIFVQIKSMYKKCWIFTLFIYLISVSAFSQIKKDVSNADAIKTSPKLVIGLVIDQMRWDYLYRYKNLYGKTGFVRLLQNGFSCENTLIKHIPTYTAVGHTGIFSGSVPAIHGIIGNNWFDKKNNKLVYCTGDSTVTGVGSDNENGKMSPRNLLADEVGDELRLSNNFSSKVIGISLKDRSAILSAGQSANAAYWFDEKTGKFISSSYYMKNLPKWVEQFNNEKKPDRYKQQTWFTKLPLDKYTLSSNDNVDFESHFPGEKTNTFPHQLDLDTIEKYEAFMTSPFGNSFTLDFAKSVIENENLGQWNFTDFLAVSLSSTDYIGHLFGPNSVEIEDTYIRLDEDIASFIDFLDARLGRNNYLIMLTSDHGVAHNSGFLESHQLYGKNFSTKELFQQLNEFIAVNYGIKNGIQRIENFQIYLSDSIISSNSFDLIVKAVVKKVESNAYVSSAFELKKINQTIIADHLKSLVSNSYCENRSGDIQIVPKPAYYNAGKKISTHGLWNPYDSHIPLIWFGWKIKPGKTYRELHMSDIAPTLSSFLNIQMPNGCVGMPIQELF